MRAPLVAVAVLGLVVFATYELVHVDASGGVMNQNDANTGGDAADAFGGATALTGSGPFDGQLAETDDSDWFEYSTSAAGPGCAEMDASGHSSITARLRSDATGHQVHAGLAQGAVNLGYAVHSVGEALAGFSRPVGSVGVATYSFSTAASAVGEFPAGDGESGGDAGPTPAAAVAAPGACFGGTLGEVAGDTRDTYIFAASAGDRLVLSLAQGAGEPTVVAEVRDAAGALVGTAGAGSPVATTLGTSGTFTILVLEPGGSTLPQDRLINLDLPGPSAPDTTGGTRYAIGLCIPYCFYTG